MQLTTAGHGDEQSAHAFGRLRDLRARLKAEEKILERETTKPNPREQEPQLRAALDVTVSKVPHKPTCRHSSVL